MAYMFCSDMINPQHHAHIIWDDEQKGWRDTKIGGTPVIAELAPTSGYIEKKKKRIPAIMSPWACWVVSQQVKDIVEGLEPGKHQFLPVRLRNGKRGEPLETPYYIMRILPVIEAVDIDRSPSLTYSRFGKRPPATMAYYDSRHPLQIVIDAVKTAKAHLWIDPWISSYWFMSDALHDALMKAKAKGLTIVTRLHDHYGRLN